MYSVLIALLAIVAYHNGIKNSDEMAVVAGGFSNSEKKSIPLPVHHYYDPSDDDDYGI